MTTGHSLQIDYSQIGHSETFNVPMFAYMKEMLTPGTEVTLVGDGVPDHPAVVVCWTEDNQLRLRCL